MSLPVATHSRPESPGLLAYAGDDDVSPMDAFRIELRAEHKRVDTADT